MKRIFLITALLFFYYSSFATHIAGGELYYEYTGPGVAANSAKYKLTMRLFKECNSSSAVNLATENVTIVVYNNPGLSFQRSVTLVYSAPPASQNPFQNTPGAIPCLTGNTSSCYLIGFYTGEIELPYTLNGYTLVWTRYTRMNPIANISGADLGATFTTQIPGAQALPTGNNSSPMFKLKDTIIVCRNQNLNLDYGAVDPDGDSLSYKFVSAFDGFGGSASNPAPFNSPTTIPSIFQLIPLNYNNPYSGTSPLGSNVVINNSTGEITGAAPASPGKYVVCVAIEEWRNGEKINEHRKDFILTIGDCSVNQTYLGPDIKTCNGITFTFINDTQGQFTSYAWSLGDGTTSTLPVVNHTYQDTGRFLVKLVATSSSGCKDSATKYVYVYPGFIPAIKVVGSCYQTPIKFYDSTKTAYGFVNSWKWDFGDLTTIADTATSKDTAWLYPSFGSYDVKLIATNSKGCIDTVTKNIIVRDKPIINLPFKDTLICTIDTLALVANSSGTFSWTPNYNIINPTSSNPLVYPKNTTTYIIKVNDNGCINSDSIKVNTLEFIKVDAGLDSAICQTDTFRLRPISAALSYLWISSTGVPVDPIKYPLVQPFVSTKYYVKANLGKCQDNDSVFIKVAPYPKVSAVDVNPICFGSKVQLNASIVGSNFYWTPTNSLLNPNTLTPVAGPSKTTNYIITSIDTVGCPKPVSDTITVVVVPIVTVNAGKDTAVVLNQPLPLFAYTNAAAGSKVKWYPSTGLNFDTIYNPITILNIGSDSIKYKVRVTTSEGCFGEDEIVVRLFRTEPDIFIPTAFTPNRDGKNDILKPICVGITKLDYFRIYNRWGQLIYETKEFENGWNGSFGGKEQASGTYVFMAQGVDYLGRVVFKKGTAVLIR